MNPELEKMLTNLKEKEETANPIVVEEEKTPLTEKKEDEPVMEKPEPKPAKYVLSPRHEEEIRQVLKNSGADSRSQLLALKEIKAALEKENAGE